MPHKNGDTIFFKKTKIRDITINNNIAPNNVLVGDTNCKRIYSTLIKN